MEQHERNEYPHVWGESVKPSMERYRDLTVTCIYCGKPLVPNSNWDWQWVDWREKRKNEVCIGIMNLVLDKWQPPVV